ncbi:MAG: zinc metallopeptidase [Saprospiraceae bacterium]|nr:zinc metallopeptidase [Saprospiraceae bacterium]
MKFNTNRKSDNLEDRRGGGGNRGRVAGRIGLGTIVVLLATIFLGEGPAQLLNQILGSGQSGGLGALTEQSMPNQAIDDEQEQFVNNVLVSTEEVWGDVFRQELGKQYREPGLVMFDRMTSSHCGTANSATGPFYCPADQKAYLDFSFFSQMKNRMGAGGDFAYAYVISHEVAHHVQNLLGYTDYVHKQRSRISKTQYNQLSVRLELQADFLAGVWARKAEEKGLISLDRGDIEEALRAANAIGDDRIQKQSQGYVVPDSFTHCTSEQRMRWFYKGYETGDISQGDTFRADVL